MNPQGTKCAKHRYSDRGGLPCPGCSREPVALIVADEISLYDPVESEDKRGPFWRYRERETTKGNQ